MSQHDYDIANQSGAAFRSDINNALGAIVGLNSGASAPGTIFANMFWYDTSTGQLKRRNNANSAWELWPLFDASGNIGQGVAPSAWATYYRGIDGGDTGVGGALAFGKNSLGDAVLLVSNAYHDGANWKYKFSRAAGRLEVVNNTITYYDAPTGTAGNNATFSQRFGVDSSGNFLVGTASVGGAQGFTVVPGAAGGHAASFIINKTATGGETAGSFRHNGTQVGSITYNDTATSFNTSSDYRLKENVKPMTGALEAILALKPVTYTWKVNGSEGEGFIAHELQSVCPHAVTGEKDGTRMESYVVEPEKRVQVTRQRVKMQVIEEMQPLTAWMDGKEVEVQVPVQRTVPCVEMVNGVAQPVMEDYLDEEIVPAVIGEREIPDYQGIDTSFLAGRMVAAIQEQQAIIAALTERLEALEAK